MTTTMVPSLSGGRISELQKASEIPRPTLMPSLVLGEKLNVLVLSNSLSGKTLLQIKNSTLLAESPLPLQSGRTLAVQVDQLHPILVLRTTDAPDQELSITNQFLKIYRSNPDAFKDVVASLNTLFTDGAIRQLSTLLLKQEIQNLRNVLKQIVISKDNIDNPLFLKDYVGALGLTGESRLLKALSDPSVLKEQPTGITLKETLLNLSNQLSSIQTTSGDGNPDGLLIRQFSDLVDRAATVIESLQIVNVLAQRQDNLYMLQIPIQFPGGILMQEIFIQSDQGNGKQEEGKQCRVVFFLDMDSLGKLAVDMGITDTTLNCTFKCQAQEIVDFLQPMLPALGQAISETNYAVGVIRCVIEPDVRSWMQDFFQDQSLFTQNSIDLSV